MVISYVSYYEVTQNNLKSGINIIFLCKCIMHYRHDTILLSRCNNIFLNFDVTVRTFLYSEIHNIILFL